MADDRKILESQRAAIREHKAKYELYKFSDPDAMNMALRTIRSCQSHIEKLLNRHPHWESSWEDIWTPDSE